MYNRKIRVYKYGNRMYIRCLFCDAHIPVTVNINNATNMIDIIGVCRKCSFDFDVTVRSQMVALSQCSDKL